jgi:signal transduction histidine kinase
LVEDSEHDAAALFAHLAKSGLHVVPLRVDNRSDYERALAEASWDLIIADSGMPGFSGRAALALLKERGLPIPFLVLSGSLAQAAAASALEAGAADVIPKGNWDGLTSAIKRALAGQAPVSSPPAPSAPSPPPGSHVIAQGQSESDDASIQAARPTLLLVDDRVENLMALEIVLSDLGADLERAGSGDEALNALLKIEPACILLDVRMPGLDGPETARLIKARAKSRHIPLLFLTANFDSTEEIEHLYAVGAADYIPKPIVPQILRGKVRVYIELWQRTQEARRQGARVEALNRELDHFTAAVAHDLRAPLRSIAQSSEALLEDYSPVLGDVGRDFARRIDRAARKMDVFIADLLRYAHLDQEKLSLSKVRLEELVVEVVSDLKDEIRSSGASMNAQAPFFPVRAHALTLKRILTNLIRNALKFVDPGHSPAVTIWSERNKGRIRLWVQDNGIGIAPENLERIFEPFVRLHSQEAYPGSGLGLVIVRKAVERMGGAYGCESQPGHGSGFWVDLPQG